MPKASNSIGILVAELAHFAAPTIVKSRGRIAARPLCFLGFGYFENGSSLEAHSVWLMASGNGLCGVEMYLASDL